MKFILGLKLAMSQTFDDKGKWRMYQRKYDKLVDKARKESTVQRNVVHIPKNKDY